jgi:hypothetical protein
MKDYSQINVKDMTDQELNGRLCFLARERLYFEKELLLINGEISEVLEEQGQRNFKKSMRGSEND